VVGTASLESVAENIGRLLNAEVESTPETCQIRKQRLVKNSKGIFCLMDVNTVIESLKETGIALNKARVFLLPEELPCFALALRQHAIPFPTNFSQSQTCLNGVYCFHLETQEPPEDFAERLAAALTAIE
jgi:hypothetical protein